MQSNKVGIAEHGSGGHALGLAEAPGQGARRAYWGHVGTAAPVMEPSPAVPMSALTVSSAWSAGVVPQPMTNGSAQMQVSPYLLPGCLRAEGTSEHCRGSLSSISRCWLIRIASCVALISGLHKAGLSPFCAFSPGMAPCMCHHPRRHWSAALGAGCEVCPHVVIGFHCFCPCTT